MKMMMTFFFILLSVFLIRNIQRAETATDSLDFEIAANCLPHSEVSLPAFLNLQYGFVGKVQGSSVEASLRAGGDPYELTEFRFGLPENGWVSMIFPGPVLQTKLYCQNLASTQPFYVSGDRFSKMKIYLSRDGHFSDEELALNQNVQKSVLKAVGDGKYKNEFRLGRDTPNPYWLQFALPMTDALSIQGQLNFEVP